MNNWIKISSEELEKSKEIIGLKKGDLQIQLVKALVKIDKAVEILSKYKHYIVPDEKQNSDNEELANKAYELLKGEQ